MGFIADNFHMTQPEPSRQAQTRDEEITLAASKSLPNPLAAIAADALGQAFCWHDTREGQDYWMNIYDRICRIAMGEEL